MNPFSLERKCQSLRDWQNVQFMWEKCALQKFYKFICQKDVLCILNFWEWNFTKVQKKNLILYSTNLENFNKLLISSLPMYKQIYHMFMVRYLGIILSCASVMVWTFDQIFFCHFKEWTDQKISKQSCFYFNIRGRKREWHQEKSRKQENTGEWPCKKYCSIWSKTSTLFWFWTSTNQDWKVLDSITSYQWWTPWCIS